MKEQPKIKSKRTMKTKIFLRRKSSYIYDPASEITGGKIFQIITVTNIRNRIFTESYIKLKGKSFPVCCHFLRIYAAITGKYKSFYILKRDSGFSKIQLNPHYETHLQATDHRPAFCNNICLMQ